jgi:glycosyltransferase involved in cell wall biosynthesis
MSESLSIAMIGLRGIPTTFGGVERAVEELSARLVQRGHSVTVYGRTSYVDASLREHRGVELRNLPQIDTKHWEAASHTLLAALDAVRSRRFDVLHFHATGPAVFAAIPRALAVPCVATVQGLDWRREKWGRVASTALRFAARAAGTVPDETIVVSRELQRVFRESYGAETEYIPNGVEIGDLGAGTPVVGLEPGCFVLFLGRLVPEKGVHTLIEAFRDVDTDQRLAIAGPSSHSEEYVRELHALAAPDPRVLMLGPRYGPEKAWLLRNATLFVQPSTVEGLPITLLESVACERYPVVSDISENVEAVTSNGRTFGTTFRTGDAGSLTTALREALANPAREAEAREAAQAVLTGYDWDEIAASTERVYRKAVARRGDRRWAGRT